MNQSASRTKCSTSSRASGNIDGMHRKKKDIREGVLFLLYCFQQTKRKKQPKPSCFFVECPAKLSNFFEDFNKIVEFIEKHCVLNKGYNINSL